MFPEKILKDKNNIFSGEREIGTKIEEFSADHINRYNFAKYFINKKDIVLDAACGVGYGSSMMAEKASRVIGIDYSEEAIKYAKNHWAKRNILFIQGDLLYKKTYPEQKFNVIVSFETIEHLKDDKKYLKLIADHLHSKGILFISSPNSEKKHAEDNPWHFRHYTPDEFKRLVQPYFKYVSQFTQIYNGIKWGKGGDNNVLVCSRSPRYRYKILIYLIHKMLYHLKREA